MENSETENESKDRLVSVSSRLFECNFLCSSFLAIDDLGIFFICSLELSIRRIYQVLSRTPPPHKQAEKSDLEMWSGSGDYFPFNYLFQLDLLIRIIWVLSDESSSSEKPKDKKKKSKKDQDSNVSFFICKFG